MLNYHEIFFTKNFESLKKINICKTRYRLNSPKYKNVVSILHILNFFIINPRFKYISYVVIKPNHTNNLVINEEMINIFFGDSLNKKLKTSIFITLTN